MRGGIDLDNLSVEAFHLHKYYCSIVCHLVSVLLNLQRTDATVLGWHACSKQR